MARFAAGFATRFVARVWKIVRWGILISSVLLVLLIIGLGLFLQTDQFRSLAREQVVDTLNTTLKGRVSLDRIEGTLWGSLILHNFRLDYADQTLIQVPQLIARYALRPLLDGRLQILQLKVVEPIVSLEQDAEGTINLLEAVSPTTPQEDEADQDQDSPSSLIVNLDSLIIEKGRITFRLPDQAYQLVETDLEAQIDIIPAGLTAQIRRFATQLEADGLPALQAQAALTYQNAQAPPSIDLQHASLNTDHSELQLSGAIENIDTLEANIELVLKKLAVADIVRLVPDAPLKHDIVGTVHLTGQLSDLHGAVVLNTADATLKANLQADLSQSEPHYQAAVHVHKLALPQLVDAGDIRVIVNGTLQAQGVGASIPLLDAKADLTLTELHVGDLQLGTLALQGSFAKEIAQVNGELTGAVGHAAWQGQLVLAEPPQYSLSLAADRLSLQKMAPKAAVDGQSRSALSGELNLQANVQGHGFDLETMTTQADITIQPSTFGPVTIKHGRFVAALAGGRIQLSEGALTTPDASIQLEGELGTALEEVGQLSYTLQIDRLAPWLTLAGQDGSGKLALKGRAEGSLKNLQTQGRLVAQRLQLPGLKLAQADIQFTAEQIGQAAPLATVGIGVRDLEAGVALQSIDADVQLLPAQTPSDRRVQLAVTVQHTPDRRHHLQAEVLAHDQHLTAQLSDLSLASPIGSWRLAQPVTIQYQSSGETQVTIDRFVLIDTRTPTQQLSLHGAFTTNGPQNLQLQIADFSLRGLKDLLPSQPAIDGVFSADLQLRGTAATPMLQGQAGLTGLQIAGQAYQGLKTTVDYHNKKANLALSFQQDADHALHATGSLPLALSWANGFQATVLGEPQFRARSDGLNLAFLNAFSGKAVHDIRGKFHLDLEGNGPADKPVLNGSFGLTDGQAKVRPLGLTIAPITLEGTLSPQQIAITRLSAKAREGTLTANAAVGLKDYRPARLTASLKADHWPAIWTHQYRVEIDSDIAANGPLDTPNVNGHIDIWEAVLRPELSFLSAQPLTRDETITVRPTADAPPVGREQEEAASPEPDSEPDIFTNLAMLLTINLHHNSRVLHQNANIALTGGIEVKKQRGGDPQVAGVIELERGWAGFQGRRFVLSQGKIMFTGGATVNPRLDILAQYEHDDYLIDAVVGGTGEEPSLDLRSDPPLEQADILSVLLFGKPASALGKGEKANLQQQAVSLTSGYAASTIGRSVSDALGLDALGIDLSDVDFSGGRVGFGRSLNRKTRISASQNVGGEEGQEVAIDYEIAPDWDFRTTTSSKGSSGADIIWRKRY